jgi:hypothetical protein
VNLYHSMPVSITDALPAAILTWTGMEISLLLEARKLIAMIANSIFAGLVEYPVYGLPEPQAP